ncbi:MAG: DNA-binding protein [Solobacterium sp.]|nr:DNA-binding protein [Solobacterium sp.]
MENKIQTDRLLVFYGCLLTERQQEIAGWYYSEDYSLQEIAEITGTSRAAVYDTVRKCRTELERYESLLHLLRDHDQRGRMYQTLLEKGNQEIQETVHLLIDMENN